MANVKVKVVDTKTVKGEKFNLVSVSGRERWVSERGTSELRKMARKGATALQIRKAAQHYTTKKTLGYTETVTETDAAGLKTVYKKVHKGYKQRMIDNLNSAMDKTDVPDDVRQSITDELNRMTEKEISDFFEKKTNKKYLDTAFRYEESDDEGHKTALDDPQASNAEIAKMLGKKSSNASSLLFKLKNRKML